ncbi:MAG: hypothetical protein WKF51_07470 [Geodermatophilaceae bacterium]
MPRTETVSALLSLISAIAASTVSVPSVSFGPMIGLAWETCNNQGWRWN